MSCVSIEGFFSLLMLKKDSQGKEEQEKKKKKKRRTKDGGIGDWRLMNFGLFLVLFCLFSTHDMMMMMMMMMMMIYFTSVSSMYRHKMPGYPWIL